MVRRLLFVICVLATVAFGQTTGTATLVGTVSDNTGAIVPGATVNLVNVETQFVYNGQTTSEGSYYVPNLSPGTYRLTIEASGSSATSGKASSCAPPSNPH
jgi:uncharacterized protein YfaS (alpha-2-macroglobulin family)